MVTFLFRAGFLEDTYCVRFDLSQILGDVIQDLELSIFRGPALIKLLTVGIVFTLLFGL